MRKATMLSLSTVALMIGILIGAIDARTGSSHTVPRASAEPIGGGNLGCDGHGAAPACAACPDRFSCAAVCVGHYTCLMSVGLFGTMLCNESLKGCTSGGTRIGGGGGKIL